MKLQRYLLLTASVLVLNGYAETKTEYYKEQLKKSLKGNKEWYLKSRKKSKHIQQAEKSSALIAGVGVGYLGGRNNTIGECNIAAKSISDEVETKYDKDVSHAVHTGWAIGTAQRWVNRLQKGGTPGFFDVIMLTSDVLYAYSAYGFVRERLANLKVSIKVG